MNHQKENNLRAITLCPILSLSQCCHRPGLSPLLVTTGARGDESVEAPEPGRLGHPEPGSVTPMSGGVNKTWARLLNPNRVTIFNLQPQPNIYTRSCVTKLCPSLMRRGIRLSLEHLVSCPHTAPYLMIASIYLMAQIYLFNHSRTYASRKCMSRFK